MKFITLTAKDDLHHINLDLIAHATERWDSGIVWVCFSDADNDLKFKLEEAMPLLEAMGIHPRKNTPKNIPNKEIPR